MAKKMTRFQLMKNNYFGEYYIYSSDHKGNKLLDSDEVVRWYMRRRDAIRGFTRFVNRYKLSNVVLEVDGGPEIIYI